MRKKEPLPPNIINEKGYEEVQNRIKEKIENFRNSNGFGPLYGHTFNSKTNKLILPYQQHISENISSGIFTIIYLESNLSNLNLLMEIQYDLCPTLALQNDDNLEKIAKIFLIRSYKNTKDNITNELFVFYVHRPFQNKTKQV